MILWWLAFIALLLAALLAGVLWTPIVFRLDTGRREFEVRWTVLLRFVRSLVGTEPQMQLHLAGIPIELPQPKPKPVSPEPAPPARARKRPSQRLARVFWRCARDAAIRRSFAASLARLLRGIVHSMDFTPRRVEISLADPARNGMLAGWAAAAGWSPAPFDVNFLGRNRMELEMRLRPHRLALPLLTFLFRLPFRAIVRQWRASKNWTGFTNGVNHPSRDSNGAVTQR